jgi:outer membrane protein TolC
MMDWTRLLLVAVALAVGGCTVADPQPFSADAIRRIQLDRARENQPRAMERLPTTLRAPWVPAATGPAGSATSLGVERSDRPATRPYPEAKVVLSLADVVHRTVALNSEVRVASYDSAINQARVVEAEARFDPTFFSNIQYQRQFTGSQFNTNPLDPSKQRSTQAQAGLRQVLPTGAQLELRYQTTRTEIDNVFFTNPFYQNELSLQVTQPLLQDFGTEVNRARIAIARNDQAISRLDWRLKIEEQVAKAEEAYWKLVQAYHEVAIAEDLLSLTRETARILEQRRQGDVSDVQLWQTYSAIRQRELFLVRARTRVRDVSDVLKQIMGDPNLPVASGDLIVAADAPVQTPIRIDPADQIEAALKNRPELEQQTHRIDSATVIARAAKNNRLPTLNAVGSIGVQGVGEGLGEALRSQGNTDFINYAIGLSFEIPLGNRSADAIWQRTLLQRQQAIAQYQAIVEGVSLEVLRACRELQTSWEELVAAGDAVRAAGKSLQAIEAREPGEALTFSWIQLKLDRQGALAEARRTEINARVSYNVAISALERAKGTILRYNHVVLQEDVTPFGAP